MKAADYLIMASLMLILLLEVMSAESAVPVWINGVVSVAAVGVAVLLWRDTREQPMGKEK